MRYPDLGLICLGLFVELIGVGAIVPIRSIYARDHGATAAEIGFLAAGFLLGQFVFQYPGGWASDRWGRKPLLVGGIAVAGVISFLFLANDNPWYFIALRFIEGAAGGAIGPVANAYVMDAVPAKERGAAFGWLGSAFSAGFMMGPALGGLMVDAFGYASPFIFGGVTSLGTALFLLRKMTNRKPGERPAEIASTEGEAADAKPAVQVPRKLFMSGLLATLLITAAGGFGDGIFISIWSIWLSDLHASTTLIGLTFITFSLPVMLFMPITGKMADKYRLAPLIAIPGGLISFVYLTYGFTTDLLLITMLGLVEGTFIALLVPAQSAFLANLSPEHSRGKLQGLVSTVRTIAGFTSSILTALLYGVNHSYPWYMLFSTQIVIMIVGGLMVWRVERRINPPGPPTGTSKVETGQSLVGPVLESAAK